MRENMALLIWLETAVSGIRFKPDRAAVQAELYAHLEDKALDLLRLFPDMDPDEARDRALAGMGDAEELKQELARVHRPWLGWLWTASRWLVRGLLVLCLLLAVGRVQEGTADALGGICKGIWEGRAAASELFGSGEPSWDGERLALYAPEAEARMGNGSISVPRAAWWEVEGKLVLFLQIRMTWDRPWEASLSPWTYFRVEDAQGREPTMSGLQSWDAGLSWRQWNLALWGLSPESREVTLTYLPDLPGVGPELTIELTEEVEP